MYEVSASAVVLVDAVDRVGDHPGERGDRGEDGVREYDQVT
jgi:hypothetical protein